MTRRKQLDKIFKNIDDEQKKLVDRLLDEVVFLEDKMTELKQYPFIRSHPNDLALQKPTAAAKLYKECNASYSNIIRILLSVLNKEENSEINSLLKRLEEFS